MSKGLPSSNHRLRIAALWLTLAVDVSCEAQVTTGPTGLDHAVPAPSHAMPAKAEAVAAKFDAREIKTTAEPGVGSVELCYEFTNTGDIPLAVEDFSHACGCLQGVSDGVPVLPGARGKITAKLLTKGLRGTVRKSLHVTFVECGTVELVAEVSIPEALVYSAQTLRWGIGEAVVPRQVDITIRSKKPVRVLSVKGGDPLFSSELVTIEEGRRYRVTITPSDTATQHIGIFQVRTDSSDSRDALQGLFALVEGSKPGGGTP